jgi:hypothetical protein
VRPLAEEQAADDHFDADCRGDGQKRPRPALEEPERQLTGDQDEGHQHRREVAMIELEARRRLGLGRPRTGRRLP